MRDLALFGAMLFWVPLAFANPFVAYLLWGYTALASLVTYLYGFMQSVQYNYLFALMSLAFVLMGRDRHAARFEMNKTAFVLVLFCIQSLVTASFAYNGLGRNWIQFQDNYKIAAFCFAMPMLVTSRQRIHALLLALAFGLCIHGLIDGLKFISSAGGHTARGNPKFGDNNHFAVAVAMGIPLARYLAQYLAHAWMRWGFAAIMTLSSFAVVATRSRGGLLCLLVIAAAVIVRSRQKLRGIVAVAVAAAGIVALSPAEWTERMNTMKSGEEDGSFMGRVMAWKRSSAIAVENPLTGGGFFAVQEPSLYWKFATKEGFLWFVKTPPPDGIPFAAHSIYFQVIGDQGFIGFLIYVSFIACAFVSASQIRREARRMGRGADWAYDLADALNAALVVFLVGGAFVSLAYFELTFMIAMLLETVKRQLREELAGTRAHVGAQQPPRGEGT